MKKILSIVLAASLAMPFSGFADDNKKPKDDVEKIGERNVGKGLNLYSIDKEIAMGKQLADEIERQAKIVRDPIVAEYINRVGQNLARHSDTQIPFTFKVIDAKDINAFALPGGYCFVHTGLILEADTEAEMAGVLAHEIAHVAARHGTRQATRGTIANLATIPLMIAIGGWTGYGIQQAASIAIPAAFMQFSRAFEREADHLGLQYLYAAGYDPTSFVDFFEKLASLRKTRPGALASVFSSHPMTDDRIEAAQQEMDTILPGKAEYLVNTSEFLKVQERLNYLINNPDAEKEDLPRVRRARRTTVILPPGQEPGETGAEEDEGPPVLKRAPGSGQAEEEDGPPVMKRPDGS